MQAISAPTRTRRIALADSPPCACGDCWWQLQKGVNRVQARARVQSGVRRILEGRACRSLLESHDALVLDGTASGDRAACARVANGASTRATAVRPMRPLSERLQAIPQECAPQSPPSVETKGPKIALYKKAKASSRDQIPPRGARAFVGCWRHRTGLPLRMQRRDRTMTNRLQPGTTPHDTEKCQILISRPVALIAAAAGQSVSRNYRRPLFGKLIGSRTCASRDRDGIAATSHSNSAPGRREHHRDLHREAGRPRP
jgi:hypothetical protein